MKVIEEKIGNATILVQALDEELEIIGKKQEGRSTHVTGVNDKLQEAYKEIKVAIRSIAQDIGQELSEIKETTCPKQVEMEFNMGISLKAGPIWLLSGSGNYGLKIKMIWSLHAEK